MSEVDVVIPCHNYGRFLPDCVESVLRQCGVSVRVLVIDDASSDDTAVIGARLAATDARVEFVRHPVNRGHIATYNEGLLDWCEREYSLLLSADDLLSEGALARAVAVLDGHRDSVMAYGMANSFMGNASPAALDALIATEVDPPGPRTEVIAGEEFLRYCFYRGNPVPTATAIVRTSAQHRVGGYRVDLPHSGDLEMWMRLALEGPIALVRRVQAHYRFHTANMTYAYTERTLGDRREILSAAEMVTDRAEALGSPLPVQQWLSDLRLRLATDTLELANTSWAAGDRRAVEECLAFAGEVCPGSLRTKPGRRLQIKRLIGPRATALVSSVLSRRRASDTASRKVAASNRAASPKSISGFRDIQTV